MLKPLSSLTLHRRSVLAAPALILPERAHAWTHGAGGSPPPPPGGNAMITEAGDTMLTEAGNTMITES